LRGGSPARIAFLRQFLEEMPPGERMEPVGEWTNTYLPTGGVPGRYGLTYFGFRQSGEVTLLLPDEGQFRVDVIDTWVMKVTELEGPYAGETLVKLPGKPYIAL
jgi:hypothetical protein